ncbi:MAG: MBL fold metallo-hydrolase [Spirochaetia bacterium]|nr:MBL fold metallo-hydrolase [Spirochaetia bacterium]
MIIKKYTLGPVQTNCYLLICSKTKKAAIIDPGDRSIEIADLISAEKYELSVIINTHGHFDHIGGNKFFSGGKVPVAAHILEYDLIKAGGGSAMFGIESEISPDPSIDASQISEITFGETTLEVIHTPGHTQGHISLYHKESSSLFCGDVLFFRSIGRTDLPGGSQKQLLDSIRKKLYTLPGETVVYPGHGGETSIEDERKHNPWTAV